MLSQQLIRGAESAAIEQEGLVGATPASAKRGGKGAEFVRCLTRGLFGGLKLGRDPYGTVRYAGPRCNGGEGREEAGPCVPWSF